MKTNHADHPQHQLIDLAQALEAFRAAYTPKEAQEHLWRLLQPALLTSAPIQDTDQGSKTIAFWERLKVLLAAVYGEPVYVKTAEAAVGPVASALDTLHQEVKQPWVLLISPPE